jgi:hypothetical protein
VHVKQRSAVRNTTITLCVPLLLSHQLLLLLLLLQVVMRTAESAGPDGIARVCGLCLALITLSQGIPFIHAGDDLLRSKSLDRDSYNSGGACKYVCRVDVGSRVGRRIH